jgi:predicted RNase H-related nuclease YkuK (DUF458 family)
VFNQRYGKVDVKETINIISNFIDNILSADKNAKFEFFIGTDSQKYVDKIVYATCLAVHYIGNFGIFFIDKHSEKSLYSNKERLFNEAVISLNFANNLLEEIKTSKTKINTFLNLKTLEIHVDFGNNGESKSVIPSAVGMLTGAGFNVKIKPNSCCASNIADKFTKNIGPRKKRKNKAVLT